MEKSALDERVGCDASHHLLTSPNEPILRFPAQLFSFFLAQQATAFIIEHSRYDNYEAATS